MGYIDKMLAQNEHVARVAHEHWIALLPTILIDVAIAIVIIGLSVLGLLLSPPWTAFGFLLLLAPLVHFLIRLWVWRSRQYVVTNRRVIQISGVFDKRVSDTALEKVNDIVMEQSTWGRMLQFGDIEIISGSDIGVNVFRRIADPIGFKKDLLDQKGAFGGTAPRQEPIVGQAEQAPGKEAPGVIEIPALIAELDELRKKGLLTDAEFEEKKKQLLNRI